LPFITASALSFGVFSPREEAVAQTANELVGTWTLVSSMLEKDGKTTDFYGPNPKGQLMYDANGHFSVIITRSDLAKFASNNREAGTPEENNAVVQGSFAYFGTSVRLGIGWRRRPLRYNSWLLGSNGAVMERVP
jgi:hypothetical protein